MKIKMLSRLNGKQRSEIRELEELCRVVDKTKATVCLTSDLNIDSSIKRFYLAYLDKMLVGFLGVFLPDGEHAEIGAFVHPTMRKRGYFSKLYDKADKELREAGVTSIFLIHEPASIAAFPVLKAMDAVLTQSEYLLSYKQTDETGFRNQGDIYLETADIENLEEIKKIYLELFPMEEEEAYLRLKGTVNGKSMRLYQGIMDGIIIGFCSVAIDKSTCCIFDFGIAKDYQKKGYGRTLLELIIHELRNDSLISESSDQIILHVNSKNEAAYRLYRKFGFQIDQQYDYYLVGEDI